MKSDELLDAIGEAKDEYVQDVRNAKVKKMPGWAKWTSAIAACLVLTIGVSLFFGGMGGNAGSGGDDDLKYMYYVGPVLPLTVQGDASGLSATRNVDYNFSGYYTYQESYDDSNGEPVYYDRYDNKAYVTDSYVLTNESGEDKTVTLLYPHIGNMREYINYPSITVDGNPITATMHPGPYSGGFEGAWGSNEAGTVNIDALDCFEGYQTLLSTDAYMNSAFDSFPVLDQKVYVYHMHDFVYSEFDGEGSPTLSFDFYVDYDKTFVFSYGTNGASWDYESGYCSRRKGDIQYHPNVAPERQHPDDGYIILLGEDLEEYTLQGYQDGGCDPGEELDDLNCTITRYESTLGEVLAELMPEYLEEMIEQLDSERFGVEPPAGIPSKELYLGLAAELLESYGQIGTTPVERYDSGMLEDIFSAVYSNGRVIYFSFEVTIPAGESITVVAGQPKDASMDYVGKDKGKDGFDMATRLGSNLTFTEQTASICRYEEIEIIAQNFGFDLENGITEVTLDLSQDHYWMQVRKVQEE